MMLWGLAALVKRSPGSSRELSEHPLLMGSVGFPVKDRHVGSGRQLCGLRGDIRPLRPVHASHSHPEFSLAAAL